MNIPNFIDAPLVDKDGVLTDTWKQIFSVLFSQLQTNLSNEGFKIPAQSASNISILNNDKSNGALVYDSTNHLLKINLNGTFKTIATL